MPPSAPEPCRAALCTPWLARIGCRLALPLLLLSGGGCCLRGPSKEGPALWGCGDASNGAGRGCWPSAKSPARACSMTSSSCFTVLHTHQCSCSCPHLCVINTLCAHSAVGDLQAASHKNSRWLGAGRMRTAGRPQSGRRRGRVMSAAASAQGGPSRPPARGPSAAPGSHRAPGSPTLCPGCDLPLSPGGTHLNDHAPVLTSCAEFLVRQKASLGKDMLCQSSTCQ